MASQSYKINRNFLIVALILSVAVASWFTFFTSRASSSEIEVSTLPSKKVIHEFPDGSKAHLNAVSSIHYHAKDWNDNRTVTLNGEAHFTVEKGNVFTVLTPGGNVTVVGTEFNVRNRGPSLDVTCYSGSVLVNGKSGEKKTLQAGEAIRMHPQKPTITWTVASINQPDWREGITYLKSVTLDEAFDEIERQFNINIDHSAVKDNPRFTVNFDQWAFKPAIETITLPLNLNYRIIDSDNVEVFKQE